jgi:hypothetical protein
VKNRLILALLLWPIKLVIKDSEDSHKLLLLLRLCLRGNRPIIILSLQTGGLLKSKRKTGSKNEGSNVRLGIASK